MDFSRLVSSSLWQSRKTSWGNTDKEKIEIAINEMGALETAMSSSEFRKMEKKEAGDYLFTIGKRHLDNHYETEGGNQAELNLALSFFYESVKLGNQDAEKQLRIQQNAERATHCYNKGLKYWGGLDGYEVDKNSAKRYMKQACDLGLFAAAEWCKKNLDEPYLLVVKLSD